MKIETEFVVLEGHNLPNHSESLAGRSRFVRISGYRASNNTPTFRTRESAYRLAARLLVEAQNLPNEEEPHTWEEVLEAVTDSFGAVLDEDEITDGEESDDE